MSGIYSLLHRSVFIVFLFAGGTSVVAQSGLKGKVLNQKKEALPFASVAVRGSSIGTIANEDGEFLLALKPGYYEIVFQYLGYQAGSKAITIGTTMETFDAVLREQPLQLGEVKVGKSKEDPAYAIMRRAIAKSKYHLLQVDAYKAKAYTKSSIVITDLPMEFLYKKELENGDFKKGVPILNETVSEIEFKQPNNYKQRVVAARNNQNNNFANPNEYILTSFYKPEVVNTVSPLSPKAFAYYRFEYLGTYVEGGAHISKIQVIPRSYGDGVFRGTIQIIEDAWAIHSLDLETVKSGINLRVKQIYAPIQQVWMPIQHQFNFNGGLYGIKGKGDYVISQTFQSIQLNPNFPPDVVVLDTKVDKEEIKVQALTKKELKNKELEEVLASGKQLSVRNLRKVMKNYEKQQVKESKEKGEDFDLLEKRVSSTEIDSLATTRTNSFWDSLRTVPLTKAEMVSYSKLDSVLANKKVERVVVKSGSRDTTSGKTGKTGNGLRFSPGSLFWGQSFRLSKDRAWNLLYFGPLKGIQVNTVEGLVIDGVGLGVKHTRKADKKTGNNGHELLIKGVVRYSLERGNFLPRGELAYRWGYNSLSLEGGQAISQYNADNPISYLLNSVTTLLFEQNFAKIYQKDYLRLNYDFVRKPDHLRVSAFAEYADRTGLVNAGRAGRYHWINWNKREYTSNTPPLIETAPAPDGVEPVMPNHQALVLGTTVSYKPWQKYKVSKGTRTYYDDDSPELAVNYRKGIGAALGSDVDYDFVQVKVRHGIETGIRSKLTYQVAAGAFLNSNKIGFPDYRHFAGNRFFFQVGDPVGTFRMLDYYRLSTNERFAEAHVLAEFRQLLLTQIEWFRRYGVKETFIGHYLATPRSSNYAELGYGLDVGIRFPFRVEVVNSFEGFRYRETVIRIGTTMNLPFQ